MIAGDHNGAASACACDARFSVLLSSTNISGHNYIDPAMVFHIDMDYKEVRRAW